MSDILTDLSGIWDFIAKEAKKPDTNLETKISIFDKGLKYASIKYKVQPDEIEGSAWNDFSRTLKSGSAGGKSSKYSPSEKRKTNGHPSAVSAPASIAPEASSERYTDNGYA